MASVPPSLMNFTRDCLTQGIGRTEIRQALIDAGWTDREATAALESFAESPLPIPVPKKRVSSGPRAAFLHLLALFLLYMAAFSTGAILFLAIDIFIKDPANRIFFDLGGFARFNAAVLIASLPVLLLVRRAIMRDIALNPANRIAPVVRTLAYITLLITSLIMVCDMVVVLMGFLNGDLTITFILKSVVVLLLAGGIFLWYTSGLAFEEKMGDSEGKQSSIHESQWRPRLAWAGFLTASLSLMLVLWIAGNPFNQRLVRLDRQRVSDLRSLQGAISRFHKKEKRLPDSLSELKNSPDSYIERPADAITKKPYLYKQIDKTSYRLGAVFDLASPVADDSNARSRDGFYQHDAGLQTFDLNIK
jgi:hypothetical protein